MEMYLGIFCIYQKDDVMQQVFSAKNKHLIILKKISTVIFCRCQNDDAAPISNMIFNMILHYLTHTHIYIYNK